MFNEQAANPLESVDPGWAWAAFEPSPDQPWSLDLAAHLYRRAVFGGNWEQLQRSVAAGPQETVDELMAATPENSSFYKQASRSLESLVGGGGVQHLPAWWLYTMVSAPNPLVDRIALFWHGHFATSAAKVTDARLMHQQHLLLRKHALGKFGPMLKELAQDPAMLLWLDSAVNRKSHPNENFAREVMELFSLGIGNYTEADIREAARAFTGWEVRQNAFRINKRQHDEGGKTVMGQSGDWNGDDVIRILLSQPAAAQFIVKKLFRALINETSSPPASLVEGLAGEYRTRDYDNAWLVSTVLRSNLFFSPLAVRQRIKGPVEFAVGLLRSLEGATNMYSLAEDLRAMGQGVFYPPNVKGWDGGEEWINSATLLARANLVWEMVSGADNRYGQKVPLAAIIQRYAGDTPADSARWLAELLLGTPAPNAVSIQLAALAGDTSGSQQLRAARLVQAIATLPEYQLS
ncbi:MAG: DUF1800 family protein [Pirellulales bacterium]